MQSIVSDPTPAVGAPKRRIVGYDLARALAVMGMVFVNFKTVMVIGADEVAQHWILQLIKLLEGKAAATFVVLAGIGMTLEVRRVVAAHDVAGIAKQRSLLFKRAAFLFVVGLCYTPHWEADILHFYGLYIAIGALLLMAPARWLWFWIMAFVGVFIGLLFLWDYDLGWHWETLTYTDLWTPQGMLRHLFFNGFHPVFPWTAFLLLGMWLGKQDLFDRRRRRQLAWWGIACVAASEGAAWMLRQVLSLEAYGVSREDAELLLSASPIPPTPFYMLVGGGTATVVVALCVALGIKHGSARWMRPFLATGQLALTLYVAHVVLGMGVLEVAGLLERQPPSVIVTSAGVFCVCGVVFAQLWCKRFQRGPLEWLMRKITG